MAPPRGWMWISNILNIWRYEERLALTENEETPTPICSKLRETIPKAISLLVARLTRHDTKIERLERKCGNIPSLEDYTQLVQHMTQLEDMVGRLQNTVDRLHGCIDRLARERLEDED